MIQYGKLTTPEGIETEIVCTFKKDNFTIESIYSMDGYEMTDDNSFHEGILFEPQGSITFYMKKEEIRCGCETETCTGKTFSGECVNRHTRYYCACGNENCFIRSDSPPTKNIPSDSKGIIGGFAYEFPCGNLRMGNVESGIIKHRFFTPSLELIEAS